MKITAKCEAEVHSKAFIFVWDTGEMTDEKFCLFLASLFVVDEFDYCVSDDHQSSES